jgi:ATP-dependent Clp protease ATP-binding subunit ClpB
MNTNQYTQKTLEALQSAQTIAAAHQNQQIEQAHLLLALLQQDGGLIPQLLKKMGVDLTAFRSDLTRRLWKSCRASAAPAGMPTNSIFPAAWTA